VPRWSFERCPSLLPDVLQRDRGQRGRAVAGLPPSAIRDPPSSMTNRSEDETTARSTVRTPNPALLPMPALQRGRSDPGFGISGHIPKYSGLQGVIGMQWDGAATAAGGAYRGGDGRYLGF